MEGAGFEPAKAGPADLQSALVDRLSTPPFFDMYLYHTFINKINNNLPDLIRSLWFLKNP